MTSKLETQARFDVLILKSVGQASILETQAGVDGAVLSLKVVGKSGKLEIQTDFHVTVLG